MTGNTATTTAVYEETDRDGDLATDEVYHLLQNSRRRDTVGYFMENDGPVEIGTLAEWIAARECETSVEDVPGDARQRVYIALYQSHLSKLDENGVVEYDQQNNIVTRGPNATALEAPLEFERGPTGVAATDGGQPRTTEESEYGWLPYYLGISLGGLVAIVGSWLLGVPADALSIRALSFVLVGLYLLTALGNLYRPQGVR